MRIFVYGTLRSGESACGLLAGCESLGPAEVRGTLYDVAGRYPALVLEGDSPVRGEIWTGPEEVLERLDDYEGVADGLFRRVRTEVAGGPCWTYVAGPRLASALSPAARVPGGEWRRGGG